MVKVANQKQSTGIVKDWINKTYRDLVLPIEITHNSGVSTASTAFCTAYDFPLLEVKTRFISDQEKS
jgi:hypothetical protein